VETLFLQGLPPRARAYANLQRMFSHGKAHARMIHRNLPRTWAELDPAALEHNVAALQSHVGGKTGIIAVVKANAYGHGVSLVVPVLAPKTAMFAVANLAEAIEVRTLAPQHPILLLGPAAPDERAEVETRGFIPMISSMEEAAAFSQLSRTRRTPVHLKIDTGMGRMGIWHEDAVPLVRETRGLHGIEITGIATHLPVADEDEAFTRAQLELFHRVAHTLREEEGLAQAKIHVCNSAGAIAFPQFAGDFVRLGLAIYGSSPIPAFQARLRAALAWKSRVTLVRDVEAGQSISYGRTFITPKPMRIATIAVGYADGYKRHLSNRGAEVIIRDGRCPVLGRITMDQILADVSALDGCEAGDEVILMNDDIPAHDLAAKSGTIAWEIYTGIGRRVERLQKSR
jgi:alanine racemase